ncbi:MAG: DUF5996 family protein [Phenylobacterium sp.]|uniref:DUF5996 family protein n=1 Tax=Phenylobacterium sp. TaxID=1871053 RepID=UPI0027344CF5|nr:DUF5996 family protein [Phenylobacterium sp.]MDP3174274.1 DUF5996 family protein [Phenylobacterium sp.]
MTEPTAHDAWPPLPYAEWRETCTTLHLWSQIVGKVRLARSPWLNHSWQTPLYVTARGLSTGLVPHGARALDLEFDFVDAVLRIRTEFSQTDVALRPRSVAAFYAQVMEALDALGTPVAIHGAPNELPEATPFAQDHAARAFDADQARRFHRVLLQADRVLKHFRTGFLGKASPVHFFWGSFDLAATRFSGRKAPPHPGGVPNLPDAVAREAYSHEVSSAGFWPGGPGQEAAFYAYAYPEPSGFRTAKTSPAATRYDIGLSEFILPYEAVRTAADPNAALMAFLESTYAAAADAGQWDRAALECGLGEPGRPRPA